MYFAGVAGISYFIPGEYFRHGQRPCCTSGYSSASRTGAESDAEKIETECQFLRLLSNTPLQVDIEFLHVSSHISKNTSQNHLATFYRTFSEIKDQYYDGCIITGAPVEHLKFEDVDYWQEICAIMEWTKSHVFSTMHICWAALAGLYYHFDVPKYDLAQKMFGIFPQYVLEPHCQLLRGFNDVFHAPHSRHAEVHREDIEKVPQLKILTESPLSGVHIVANRNGRQYFITGHSEYDRDTLKGNISGTRRKAQRLHCPMTIFQMMIPQRNPTTAGDAALICCFQTG